MSTCSAQKFARKFFYFRLSGSGFRLRFHYLKVRYAGQEAELINEVKRQAACPDYLDVGTAQLRAI